MEMTLTSVSPLTDEAVCCNTVFEEGLTSAPTYDTPLRRRGERWGEMGRGRVSVFHFGSGQLKR